MNICVCLLLDDIHSFLLGVSLAVGLLGPGADSQSFKEISPSPNNEGKETAFQRTSKEEKDAFIDLRLFRVPSLSYTPRLVTLSLFPVFTLLWKCMRIHKPTETSAMNSHRPTPVSTRIQACPFLPHLSP